jgi:hypothetical protein
MDENKTYVMGSYRCGCSYGAILIRDRLEYCAIHDEEIKREYDVTYLILKANGEIK